MIFSFRIENKKQFFKISGIILTINLLSLYNEKSKLKAFFSNFFFVKVIWCYLPVKKINLTPFFCGF